MDISDTVKRILSVMCVSNFSGIMIIDCLGDEQLAVGVGMVI